MATITKVRTKLDSLKALGYSTAGTVLASLDTRGQFRPGDRVVVVGAVRLDVPRDPHFYRKELDLRLSCSYGPGRYDPAYEDEGHDYPIGYVRWTEQRNMEAFLELVDALATGLPQEVTL